MIPQTVIKQLARIQSKVQSWFGKKKPKAEPPKSQMQTFEVHTPTPKGEPDKPRPTKAYADQRQKAPRNRRHKPSKAMRNLYQIR